MLYDTGKTLEKNNFMVDNMHNLKEKMCNHRGENEGIFPNVCGFAVPDYNPSLTQV